MMVEQLELRNHLQTLWQDLSFNPRNRALAIASVVSHHGDEETIRIFTGLIECQTPPGDEREQALKLLASPLPPKSVSPAAILFEKPTLPVPASQFEQYLESLWHELAGNPRNRALAIANVVAHHGDEAVTQQFINRITAQTPPSDQRAQALRLLKPPSNPFSHIHVVYEPPPPLKILLPVDPEIGRLCILFDCASELRLWVVAHEVNRAAQGSGVITKKALRKALKSYGIAYTSRHVNRLLLRGEGLFWSAGANKNIYLCSWINLGVALVRKADSHGIDLDLNKPGVRRVLLDVSGSLEHWEAEIYAGWILHRDGLTIARITLSQLFGREPNTLRRWEAERLEKSVTIRRNYVQCSDTDRYFYNLPDHTTPYVAQYVDIKEKLHTLVRLRWQLPNSYSSDIYDTPRRGQATKVRKAVNAEYPPYTERGGQCELRYLKSRKKMKRLYHSLKFRMGELGDVNRPFYVFLGEHFRTKQGIFEITNSGFLFTETNERLPIRAEKMYFRALKLHQERKRAESLLRQKGVENGT